MDNDSSNITGAAPVNSASNIRQGAGGLLNRAFAREEMDDDVIDLKALWQAVYCRRWGIVSLTIIVVMLTTLFVYNLTPIYQATATLLIEPKEAQVVSIKQIYGLEGAGWDYLPTQFELLRSRALAEKVARKIDLSHHPEFDPRQQVESSFSFSAAVAPLVEYLPFSRPEDLIDPEPLSEEQIIESLIPSFMGRITVAPVLDTQLVRVSVEMADPVLAAVAANALVDGYISSQLDARVGMTATATSWMNERLVGLKDNLDSSEAKLQAYREQESLLDMEGVTSVSASELTLISGSLAEARQKRAGAESAFFQIQSMSGAGWRSQATVPAVIADELVQQLKVEEARALTKVEELSRRYGEKHPKLQSARSELKTASANLEAQVAVVVSGIERAYQLARTSEVSLTSSVRENKDEIQKIKRKEFKLRELQREVDVNRSLYDTFLTRLKETAATTDIDTANARVVDKAVLPRFSIKPNKRRIILLFGLLSLMLGAGLAVLLEVLNSTFKSADDVENHLQLPLLGILPLVAGNAKQNVARLAFDDEDKSFSESVRSVRTSVALSSLHRPAKVIVVTSSAPKEGKSCTASNLALAMGQVERVLLVDADMRRPSIARIFNFPSGTPGLANIAAGTAVLTECIHSVDGIDVMPAGMVPPNPQELLSSERFAKLFDVLRDKYERIIVDSPPVQAVSDALILTTFADAVIYIVKSDDTSISLAKQGAGQLLQNNAPLIGVVLSQVDIKKAKKRGYSYGGYYDYFGYSEDATGGKDDANREKAGA